MSRRAVANVVLSAAGVALLVWQVRDVGGLAEVRTGLATVGAGFALVLVLSYARFVLRAYAWSSIVGPPVRLSALTAATISGDALGNLTPLGLVASEPAKALYLRRQVDARDAFAALTAENFFYSVSVAAYVMVGAAAMLASFPQLPDAVRQSGVVALVLMAALLAVAAWVAWKRPTFASNVLSRMPFAGAAALTRRVRELEDLIYGAPGGENAQVGRMAIAEVAFHIASFVESWFVLLLLSGGVSQPLEALVLDSVNRVINVVFKYVPMRMGVDEVSSEVVAIAIGLPPGRGLIVALVRKIRMILWAGVGLALWMRRR